ncbi:MAG: permease-like cell division protein FtsX [Melioribacteraceae bacterium]|nr:permease-like cell division protein FtsX [Melioribacteraceae bacterium]
MIKFYISESFKSIGRAKLSSFITVITLSISIGFIGLSLALLLLSNKIETAWKNDIKVNVFINDSVSTKQLAKLKLEIKETENVRRVIYYSKKEAYNKFVEMTGDDFDKILEINPLPRSFSISFSSKIDKVSIQKIITTFKKKKGVDDVIYDYNLTFTILDYVKSMKVVIYIMTFLFTLISFYLLFSTSKIIIAQKMIQFNTMKLVGAKLSTIKIPLLLTGIILGFIAALICIVMFNTSYLVFKTFYPRFKFDNYLYFINFSILLLGITLGPLGMGFFTKKISLKIEEFK